MKRRICVMGLGYIGLPTAAIFAASGNTVIGVDINPEVVMSLNQARITIEEPGLEDFVRQAVLSGLLTASTKPCPADVFIIAVPTPITAYKKADLDYVIQATTAVAPFVDKGNIVVLESTSPVGTLRNVVAPILGATGVDPENDLHLAYCPERVLPGKILNELVYNTRIVGGLTDKATRLVSDLYREFVKADILTTTAETAELCKTMENTYRDVNIALANELSRICEELGVNAWEVISLCNRHPRVNIHNPGPGVGGHCLAVDPWFIVERVPELARIIRLSREINDGMPEHTADLIDTIPYSAETGRKVTVLGGTYKANIDDVRESPAIELVRILQARGTNVALFDPHIKSAACLESVLTRAVQNSDLLVLAVDHSEFGSLDYEALKKLMRTPNILDTRNCLPAERLKDLGYQVFLLGDGSSKLRSGLMEAAASKQQ